ncbi:MAG: amidohydrolase family protein [Acidobacteria bacterium]|nr:amidohydrolase family protein [Acidobacteriota bacterium]
MKIVRFLAASLAIATTAGAQTTPPLGIRDNTPHVVAFTNATIVVSPERTVDKATLVLRDGRVAAVGTTVTIPPEAVTLDATGRTLYPGFIDPYTEYGLASVGALNAAHTDFTEKSEGSRSGANAWNDGIHAEIEWVSRFAPDAAAAEELLDNGYAVVQSSKLDGLFRGRAFVASLREGLPNELVLEPQARHFASFDKGSSRQDYPESLMGSIALIRQTLLDARWYAEAHGAYAQNRNQKPPETNRALAALATNRAPFVFETNSELSLLRAARIGAEMNVSMVHVGTHREIARIDEIAALKPTIILPISLPSRPDAVLAGDELDVTLGALRLWERAPCTAGALASRGASVAFTTRGLADGEKLFENVARMIRCGLDRKAALAALTTVPAGIAGVEDEVGTLEPGRRANVTVVEGDLFDGGRVREVWIDGVLAHDAAIDFRGAYDLAFDGKNVQLEVSGTSSKLDATLSSAATKAASAPVERTKFSFAFAQPLDMLGIPGLARFRFERDRGSLSGTVALADGRSLPVATTRVSDTAKDERATEEPLVSRLTLPNVAFGWETLPKRETVLVRNATIFTSGKAGVLEGADLLAVDGRIAKLGKGLAPPSGARVIDATGKFVTPGIIDEHSHLAISQGVNEGTHNTTSEVRVADVINPDDVGIYRALAGGTTMAQLLHGSANPIGGQAQVVKFRWGQGSEGLKFDAAPPSIKFALGENVKQANWGGTSRYPQSRMGVETIMKDWFLAAREYSAKQKAWNALSAKQREGRIPPRRDLRLEPLAEILEGKRFVHAHSYVQSEILMLIRLAEELGFRIQTFTHILEGYKVASEMAKHGATAAGFSDWWAYKYEVWDAIPYSPCVTRERGVVTAINSDSAELIRRLNQEAAKMIRYCGLEPAEALEMVTINPAIALKIDRRVGSLEVGKDADFVIWNGNPLSMFSKPEQTWIEGTNYFDLTRDSAMRSRDAAEKRALLDKAAATKARTGGAPAKGAEMDAWHCEDDVDVWRTMDEVAR